jgi:hypothetical protein
MNKYTVDFVVECPSDGDMVLYTLEIQCENTIYVEKINTSVRMFKKDYHENIADSLYKVFGGKQTIVATHQGVRIETVRGA